ncbi:hypothetical protein DGWBC_1760 [Dehalogenimonas sp. WBC-2]|nr:hypothetical protein DGWBC_1760 [Dehalogenimonas sp. WBC-2]
MGKLIKKSSLFSIIPPTENKPLKSSKTPLTTSPLMLYHLFSIHLAVKKSI